MMIDIIKQQYERNVDQKPLRSMSQFPSLLAKHKEVMIERLENIGRTIVGNTEEETNIALEWASFEPIAPT